MKRTKILITTLIITLLLTIFCLNAKVLATDVNGNQEIEPRTTEENTTGGEQAGTNESNNITDDGHNHDEDIEVHEGDLYVLYGEDGNYRNTTYVMDKYVDGNVFIFGQDVKIKGKVNGSLYVFASTVTIEEEALVAVSSFIFADTIRLDGITMDMYAAARDFEMTKTGIIYRDAKIWADNATIYGQVGRNVELESSNIQVYKDEETGAYVGGNLNYYSDKKVDDMDKITVDGEVTFTEKKQEAKKTNTISDYVFDGIVESIFVLVIYAIFIFVAPKFTNKAKEYVSTKGLLAAAIGLGFTVLVPVIAFFLILTIIGVPVSLIMIVVYILALILNSSVVSIAVNEFIANKITAIDTVWKKILMILPVAFVIFLIRKLPVIGGWISAIVLFVGVGIIILYQFDKRKKEEITE